MDSDNKEQGYISSSNKKKNSGEPEEYGKDGSFIGWGEVVGQLIVGVMIDIFIKSERSLLGAILICVEDGIVFYL